MISRASRSEYGLLVEGEVEHIPERVFAWAVIMRAVWDSGRGATDLKQSQTGRTPRRKYSFRHGSPRLTGESVQREAREWILSESTEALSLRWWLDLLDLEYDAVQPKLIKQIGMQHKRKPYTCTSKGVGFFAHKKKLRNAKF